MNTGCPDALWVRVRQGKPVFWIGAGTVRYLPSEWKVLRLNCGVAWLVGGPLHRAYQQMRTWLGAEASLHHTEEGSARISLLEEMPLQVLEPLLIKSSQQLVDRFAGRVLLWFDAVERSDTTVISALRRLLLSEDTLALPWVLSFHEEPKGEVAALLARLLERYGNEARIEGEGEGHISSERFGWEQLPAPILGLLRAGALVGSSFEADAAAHLTGKKIEDALMSFQEAADLGVPLVDYGDGHFFLPPKAVERLLGSMLPSFRAFWHEKLAAWLAREMNQTADPQRKSTPLPASQDTTEAKTLSPSKVVEGSTSPREGAHGHWEKKNAQDAPFQGDGQRDGNNSSQDEWQGGVSRAEGLPASAATSSQELLDPSLSDEERAQLFASLFASVETDAVKEAARSALLDSSESLEEAQFAEEALQKAESEAYPAAFVHREIGKDTTIRRESSEQRHDTAGNEHSRHIPSQAVRVPNMWGRNSLETRKMPYLRPVEISKTKTAIPKNRARIAEHLREAGRLDEAVEQYIDASREAVKIGESQRALLLLQQAITLLEELPESPSRSLFEARALLELGRLQWLGTFPGATFSLQEALASMEAAEAALPFGAPPELLGEIASLKAGVSCDLGESKILERSLSGLTQLSRQLLAEGQPLQAARLLNEQAAVYIRLGDPVQATHLLYRSRGLFEDILTKDPGHATAQEESADTEHLLARLALHVPLRPGREKEAIALSLQHAKNAERWYAAQRRFHALGRVWGTMGRLELKRGNLQAAQQRLVQSLELQQQSGDLTGLARTHDALSQLFLLQGNDIEAVRVLAASIALNLEKGAPLGVAFNRRAFEQLLRHLQTQHTAPSATLQEQIGEVEALLLEAERRIGRVALPRTIGV